MAVLTKTNPDAVLGGKGSLIRLTDQSVANTPLTLSSVVGNVYRIVMVTVKYSASVTQNVTVSLNSGAGVAWDSLINTIALAATDQGSFIPSTDILISDDDIVDILAPAGGVGVTSAIALYLERVRQS